MSFTLKDLESLKCLILSGHITVQKSSNDTVDFIQQLNSEFNLLGAQIFNPQLIWGYNHIYSAIWHAEKAYLADKMISNSFSMEILLYASGYRQIKKAIELLGVTKNVDKIIGVLVAKEEANLLRAYAYFEESLQFSSDLSIIENFDRKKNDVIRKLLNEDYQHAYEYTKEEIEKAILQKVALLALEA